MPSPRDFIKEQNRQHEDLKIVYRAKAKELVKAVTEDAPEKQQIDLLLELHMAGQRYFDHLELEITNCGGLRGQDFEAWKDDWIITATKNLYELPRYFDNLRHHRNRLKLSPSMFEPPRGSFRNLQRFFAATCPNEVGELRSALVASTIPAQGLDHPSITKPPIDMSWARPFLWVLVVAILFGIAAIVAKNVSVWVIPSVFGVVVVLLIVIAAIDGLKDGTLQEKSFLEIVKLSLAKRFQVNLGKKDDAKPQKKPVKKK